jgi:segregation and condensation protein B
MELEQKVTRKLSRVALETLAVISYHQPVTRAEIEEIRGVALSKGTLDALLEIGWIRPKGRRRTPGRPVTWGTSESFLDHFGLESLDALPGVEELKAAGLLDARPALTALSDRGLLPGAGEIEQEKVEGEDDDDSDEAEGSDSDLLEETFGEDLLPQEVDLEAAAQNSSEDEDLGEPEGLAEGEDGEDAAMSGGDETAAEAEEGLDPDDGGAEDDDVAYADADDHDDQESDDADSDQVDPGDEALRRQRNTG